MNYFKSFSERLLQMDFGDFQDRALELFEFQARNNPIYKAYLDARKINLASVTTIEEIPFLPIGFFKEHQVISGRPKDSEEFYSSSGTTGMITSRHYIWSEEFYLEHSLHLFEREYGSIKDFHVLALLPSYLERKGSSLVRMADYFIQESGSAHSGFYLYNHQELVEKLHFLKSGERKVLLLGVTFGLLDLVEGGHELPKMDNLIVMETGGMKGRRKEMIREEIHQLLKTGFGLDLIHSEYGMTELMSQAYSKGDGKYNLPPTMRVLIRDVNDPFSWSNRSQGGVNIIDLANFYSCAFLETQDLGRIDSDGMLEVLGRFDNSELRGCNLMLN
ncbi:hypothetical protein P872_24860 [Rhodonellum psychrophilum GCM71 = DSM 17998]|uniref:Acyl transferase n=2 Tax=Rhodonellum TaxID=336827 RepID=U5C6R1_9BACT|nr:MULTISPECIES: hypothetical protein [Rhodonellum]ERM84651.1 hypothetical protein P872_24860 [Rhodonellum psychrophilum GCM71 = DSM 17998]SDY87556.1 hypothetical protein SAMN05444412_103230 [Rhodonellum ikkaensis]